MQRGDISNDIPPRVIVLFNGLLGEIPDKQQPLARIHRAVHRYKKVAWLYEIDPQVRNRLHDLTWRVGMRCDVALIDHEQVALEMEHRFARMNLAISYVYPVIDVQDLVKRLAYMPEVLYVVHGLPEAQLTFGLKGRYGMVDL